MSRNKPVSFYFLLFLWVGFGALGLKSLAAKIFDYDLWWHLAHGREMLHNQTFLRTDIFSHTLSGAEWINFEWLGQLIFFGIYQIGGLPGLFLLKILLSLLILFLVGMTLRSNGARGVGFLLAMIVVFMGIRPRLYERIELFTLLIFIGFIFLLSRARNQPGAILRRVPWILFSLMILWCNLHGGFVFGCGLVALLGLGAWWARETPGYHSMVQLSLWLLFLALFFTPFGPKLFFFLWEHLVQFRTGLQMIEEWAPPPVQAHPVFWASFVISFVLLIIGLIQRRPEARFWGPALIVFSVWGSFSYRNTALGCLVMIPFIVDAVSKWPLFHPIRSHRVLRIIFLGGGFLIFLSQVKALAKPIPSSLVQWNRLPVKACQFIKDNNVDGKMYNTYEWGGYIEWDLGPQRKIFMDGRYLFYPFLLEHEQLHQSFLNNPTGSAWSDYFDRFGINYAITTYGSYEVGADEKFAPFSMSPLNGMFPRSQWALVFWDDAGLVFVRRSDQNKELINKFEYTALWPYNISQMKHLLEIGAIETQTVQEELEKHQQLVGFSVIRSEMEKQLETVF